jgi:hypothetical protein
MAHFVEIDSDNNFIRGIVISDQDCGGGNFPESEKPGQEYIASIGIEGRWLQASYNNNFRGKFPGDNDYYDEELDLFLSKKPYENFILDENYNWIPPLPKPDDENFWIWNPEKNQWEIFEEV